MLAVVITVDRLAEQRDFGGSPPHHPGPLPHHILQLPAALRAPRCWYDAERAAVIASALYRDKCGGSIFAHRRHILVMLPRPKLGIAHALSALRQSDDRGQVAVRIRADHQI